MTEPERRSQRSRALRGAAPALVFATLVLAVWFDPLFTRRIFTGRDLLAYNLPMERVIHDAWASGEPPVWNPWISGGRPLLPNPNSGAAYPVRILLAVFSFPVAMRLYPLMHWTAAGLGVLTLLRALGAGRRGAWVGAVTYAFSGVCVSEAFYPHIQPGFALMPWIVWAVLRRPRLGSRGLLLLATLLGLDFLAGDVFTSALAIAAGLLWIATEGARGQRLRESAALAAAVLLGCLLALPQIVATALWIPLTNRAVLGMKLSEATLFSVSPLRLLELVIPYPFGATWQLDPAATWCWRVFNGKAIGLFSTLFAGGLAPLCAIRLRRDCGPGMRFSRWLLAGGLAVAILPSLLPQAWLGLASPLPLRNPEKLIVAAVLALAIFAGRGFEEILRAPARPRRWIAAGAVLAAAAGACAIFPAAAGGAAAAAFDGSRLRAPIAARHLPGALAEAGLLWMATVVALDAARSRRRVVRGLSLGLLALVPIAPNVRIPEISGVEEALAPTGFARRLQKLDPAGEFRVLGESIYRSQTPEEARIVRSTLAIVELPRRDWIQHTQALWRRGTVFNQDFDSGDLSRVESLRRISASAAGFRDAGPFFGNLSLRWGIRLKTQAPVAFYRPVGGDTLQDWDELRPAFPDIRLATEWSEASGPVPALGRLPHLSPGELLVETGREAKGSAHAGTLRVLEKRPGRIVVEYEAPDPTWLFVLRDYWPYRTVRVDGRAVETAAAYLAFTALPVPAGRHRVDWREEIPGSALSFWGPPLFLAIAAALVLLRRKAAPPPLLPTGGME